jgi:hypothetical protein
MRFIPQFTLLAAVAAVSACTTVPRKPEPLPLQLQALQTREFEVNHTTAMRSVLSVFQDLGYIIQSADKDVGFITASSPAKGRATFVDLLLTLGGSSPARTTLQTRATAVIEELRPNLTTVRLNFVVNRRNSSDGSASEFDNPIEDPEPYRVAFSKIEDAIFVRSAGGSSGATPAAAAQPPPP